MSFKISAWPGGEFAPQRLNRHAAILGMYRKRNFKRGIQMSRLISSKLILLNSDKETAAGVIIPTKKEVLEILGEKFGVKLAVATSAPGQGKLWTPSAGTSFEEILSLATKRRRVA